MENASKALLMAAGMLVALLILSLAVYLFVEFGSTSARYYEQIQEQELVKFNKDYTVFEGRENITIYEIVSLALQTKEYNTNNLASIEVLVGTENFATLGIDKIQEKIKSLSVKTETSETEDKTTYVKTYKVKEIKYTDGKVSRIEFVESNQ